MTSAGTRRAHKPFRSTLLADDAVLSKPWLAVPDPRVRVSWWITVLIALVGVGLSALLVFMGYRTLPRPGNLCLVLDEEFGGSVLDESVWTREVTMSGFGNGEFEMTTASTNNRCAAPPESESAPQALTPPPPQLRQRRQTVHPADAHVGLYRTRRDPRRRRVRAGRVHN